MSRKRKICVVTGSRADYGIMARLMHLIDDDPQLELQVVATGSHLAEEFGLTYREIEKDGFCIDKKIKILEGSVKTPADTAGAISKAVTGFSVAYAELKPDIIVILGDRYEIFAAASAALISLVPLAHISGGELTEGAFDDAMRHAITKMSHIHFTSNEDYRKRVIQLGEHPSTVFNFGDLAVDNIKNMDLMSKSEFEKSIQRSLHAKNLLITFHPATLEATSSRKQFENLLEALDLLDDTLLIFTKSNADAEGCIINDMIDSYVSKNSKTSVAFASLGYLRYISALQYVDGVVGNSSSGLIEVPSFKIGTVNIGSRQTGRIKAASIIDSRPSSSQAIGEALKKLYSTSFLETLKDVQNPFEGEKSAVKIRDTLKLFKTENCLCKKFFDVDFSI